MALCRISNDLREPWSIPVFVHERVLAAGMRPSSVQGRIHSGPLVDKHRN